MTTNERIARWLGWSGPLDALTSPYPWIEPGTCPDSERFHWTAPHYDADIRLWHGPDGILAKIEEKGLRERFISNWFAQWASAGGNGDEYSWGLINSTPAQLTAALVATIKETPDA